MTRSFQLYRITYTSVLRFQITEIMTVLFQLSQQLTINCLAYKLQAIMVLRLTIIYLSSVLSNTIGSATGSQFFRLIDFKRTVGSSNLELSINYLLALENIKKNKKISRKCKIKQKTISGADTMVTNGQDPMVVLLMKMVMGGTIVLGQYLGQ